MIVTNKVTALANAGYRKKPKPLKENGETVSHPSGSKNSKSKGTDKLDIVDYICIVKIVTLPEFLVSLDVRREPRDKELATLFQK